MRHGLACLVVALGAGLGAGAAPAGAGEIPAPGAAADGADAAALVARMSAAMRALDYEGTFVHSARGHLSSMHILHSSGARGELERLRALDGEAREVVRDHELVTCVWPATGSVVVTPSKPRRALPEIDASIATNPSYRIELAGTDRVAGLDTRVVRIRPVDALRYGYRFWIDADTHMLLRSMLVDEAGRVLEEVLFTSIEYGEPIDPARFVVRGGAERRVRSAPFDRSAPAAPSSPVVAADALGHAAAEPGDRIDFADLPPGYEEIGETYRAASDAAGPAGGAPVSHVMISDGIASVSVYVEHLPPAGQDTSAAGPSSVGAINAYGASAPDGFVTVVGEVPAATVRGIADAVRFRD